MWAVLPELQEPGGIFVVAARELVEARRNPRRLPLPNRAERAVRWARFSSRETSF